MEDPIGMQENKRLQNLPKEALALSWWQRFSNTFHILFQIEFQVLENKV
jgi:hypothetical protein